jgi:hypothetical protein
MRAVVVVIWALACLHETPCAAASSSSVELTVVKKMRRRIFSRGLEPAASSSFLELTVGRTGFSCTENSGSSRCAPRFSSSR